MKIKAVLFDLDGVLIDTLDCWVQAFNDTYRRYGKKEISKEEFMENFWGHSTEKGISHLGEDAVAYCNLRQIENLYLAKLIPGAKEILDFCSKRAKVALVTNTPRKNTHVELKMFGLEKYFDAVLTGDDVVNKKPSSDMVLKACELLGVKPTNAVLVGDTNSDLQAGRGAGCKVIGINMSGDWIVGDMFELKRLLDKILSVQKTSNGIQPKKIFAIS